MGFDNLLISIRKLVKTERHITSVYLSGISHQCISVVKCGVCQSCFLRISLFQILLLLALIRRINITYNFSIFMPIWIDQRIKNYYIIKAEFSYSVLLTKLCGLVFVALWPAYGCSASSLGEIWFHRRILKVFHSENCNFWPSLPHVTRPPHVTLKRDSGDEKRILCSHQIKVWGQNLLLTETICLRIHEKSFIFSHSVMKM